MGTRRPEAKVTAVARSGWPPSTRRHDSLGPRTTETVATTWPRTGSTGTEVVEVVCRAVGAKQPRVLFGGQSTHLPFCCGCHECGPARRLAGRNGAVEEGDHRVGKADRDLCSHICREGPVNPDVGCAFVRLTVRALSRTPPRPRSSRLGRALRAVPGQTIRCPLSSAGLRPIERSRSAGSVESRTSPRYAWCPPRSPKSRPL